MTFGGRGCGKPSGALDVKTPSEVAGIEVKGTDKWMTLIQNASRSDERIKLEIERFTAAICLSMCFVVVVLVSVGVSVRNSLSIPSVVYPQPYGMITGIAGGAIFLLLLTAAILSIMVLRGKPPNESKHS